MIQQSEDDGETKASQKSTQFQTTMDDKATMHRLALSFRSAFGVSTVAFFAHAQQPAPAYRLPPPTTPLPPASAPAREPEEITRHVVELGVVGSVGLLGCAGAAPRTTATPDPCASLGVAPGVDLDALWRLTSHLALGGWAGFTGFSWDAAKGTGGAAPGSTISAASHGGRWWSVGLEARAYLFGEGAFDPFVAFGLGGGLLSLNAKAGAQDLQFSRSSLVSKASLGATWWATSRLRLGPQLDFLWQPFGSTEFCTDGTCLDASNVIARIPNRALRLGLSVSFGVGDEL